MEEEIWHGFDSCNDSGGDDDDVDDGGDNTNWDYSGLFWADSI